MTAVAVVVYLRARLPGRTSIEGQAPPLKGPDLDARGSDRPDIKPEDQGRSDT